MSYAAGVWIFVGALALTIVLHEFGHYYTAKRFGMKVEAFFFGFGPRVFSWHRGETEYGVRLLPLGGYVKIAGMNPFTTVPEEDRQRTFVAKPKWQRAIVLSAGSAMHFVLAVIVLTALFVGVGAPTAPDTIIDGVVRGEDGGDTPAVLAGLRTGDRITAIDGRPMGSWEQIVDYVSARAGVEVALTIERGERVLQVPITPEPQEVTTANGEAATVGKIGIISNVVHSRKPLHQAIGLGVVETGRLMKFSVSGAVMVFGPEGLGQLFSSLAGDGERSTDQIGGIVSAGRLAGQAASAGAYFNLVYFLVGLIVFIGVINLAPLPPLDGGYLAILVVEKITRRDVDLRKLVPVGVAVLAFMLIFFFTVLYLDISRPLENPF